MSAPDGRQVIKLRVHGDPGKDERVICEWFDGPRVGALQKAGEMRISRRTWAYVRRWLTEGAAGGGVQLVVEPEGGLPDVAADGWRNLLTVDKDGPIIETTFDDTTDLLAAVVSVMMVMVGEAELPAELRLAAAGLLTQVHGEQMKRAVAARSAGGDPIQES